MATVEVVKMAGLMNLAINQLCFDTDVQCRASIDSGTVTEYKEALASGVVFPPLVVFYDGKIYWVADGFHRGSAYRESGATTCPCDVRQGTKRDAILFAVGANTGHGLRRSNEDKKRAVMTLLNDSEWGGKSDGWISLKCGVSQPFVSKLRPAPVSGHNGYDLPETRKGSDGKNYPVKRKPAETKAEEVDKSRLDLMAWLEKEKAEAKLVQESGKITMKPPVSPIKEAPKSIVDYPLMNTDTPDEIIRLTEENMLDILVEAWDRCEQSQRWRLIARVENVIAAFKEEKRS